MTKVFDHPDSLTHHALMHRAGKRKIQCEKCKLFFRETSAHRKHSESCSGKKIHDCQYCGKEFKRKDALTSHLERHSGAKIKCEFCDKMFRTMNDIYKHKKRLHPNEAGLKSAYSVSCNVCQRRFTDTGKAYKDHIRSHTAGAKGHHCEKCEKSFHSISTLHSHMIWHNNTNTHACKICGKEFHLSNSHGLKEPKDIRENIIRLFLFGVDKARAVKEFSATSDMVLFVCPTMQTDKFNFSEDAEHGVQSDHESFILS